MRIPNTSCQWANRAANDLTSATFQMFVTKMEDIQEEFGGSPRKQTKVETIAEGFKAVHNAQAAANLVGRKFVLSRSGKPLNITTLPTDVLRTMPLPKEYEDALTGGPAKPNTPAVSGAFVGFGSRSPAASLSGPIGTDTESRRIAFGAKRLFMELGASLEVVYAHNDGDLVVLQVIKDPNPQSMIDAVFEGGEHKDNLDNYNISFGLLKDIK